MSALREADRTTEKEKDDGRESSSSLSPASKALAIADQHYEDERRARESGNTEGESEDCTDDSIGPGSRSSVRTSGQTSVAETTSEPGELEPGLDVRKGRRGFVQHRRGNGRMKGGSLLTKEEDSFESEMESRASSSESWRYGPFVQCGGSPREMECASISEAADPAGEMLAAADALEAASAPPRAVRMSNDEVDRLSVTGLKTMARELGIATNGFKAQLQARIKEKLATDASGGTTTANGELPSPSDGAPGSEKSEAAAGKAEPDSSRPGDQSDDTSQGKTAEDVPRAGPVPEALEAEREPGSQPSPEAPCRDDAPVIASEEEHAGGEVEAHVNGALDAEKGPSGAEPPGGETPLVVGGEEQADSEGGPKGNGASGAETRLGDAGGEENEEIPAAETPPGVVEEHEEHREGEGGPQVNGAPDADTGGEENEEIPAVETPPGVVEEHEEHREGEGEPQVNGAPDADAGGEENEEIPAVETPPGVVEEHEEHREGEGESQVNGAPDADTGESLPEANKGKPEEEPEGEIPPVVEGDPNADELQDSTAPHEVVGPPVPESASPSESVHQGDPMVSEVEVPKTVPDQPVRESNGDGDGVHAERAGETGDDDDGAEETAVPESSAAEVESEAAVVDGGEAPQPSMPSNEEPIELRPPGSELTVVEKAEGEAPSPDGDSPGVVSGVISEGLDSDEPASATLESPAELEKVPVGEESSPAETKGSAGETDEGSAVAKDGDVEEDVEEEDKDADKGEDGVQVGGAVGVDVDVDGVTGDGSAASGVGEAQVSPCSEGEAPEKPCLDVASPKHLNATRSESWGTVNGSGGLPAVDEVAGEHTDQDATEDGVETKPADAAIAGGADNAPLPSPTASRVDARTVRWSVGSCVSDGSAAAGPERPKADAGGFVAGGGVGGGRGPSAAELETKFYEAVRLWAPYLKDVGLSSTVVSGAGVADSQCRAQAHGDDASLLPETRRFRSKARALAAWLDTVSPGQGGAGRDRGRGNSRNSAHRATGRTRRDEGFVGGAQAGVHPGSGEAKASCLPSPGVTVGRFVNSGKAAGVNAPTASFSAKTSSTKILSGSGGNRPGARSMSTTRSSIGGSRRSSSTTGTRSSSVQPRRRETSSRGSLSPSRSRPNPEVSANSRLSISSTASAAPRLGAMASTVSSRNNIRSTKRESMLVKKMANGGKPTRGVLSASRTGSISGSRLGSVAGSRAGSIAGSDASSVAVDVGTRSVAGSRSSLRGITRTGSRQVCRTGSVTSATGSSSGKASTSAGSMESPARMRLSKGAGRLMAGGTSPPRHPRVGSGRPGVIMSPVGSSGTRVGVRAASETGAGGARRSAGYLRKGSDGGREHGFVARNVARASRLPGVVDDRGDEAPRTPQRPLRLRSKGSTASSIPARQNPLRSRARSGTNPSLSPVLANATARVPVSSPGRTITPPRAGGTRVSGSREALRVFGIEPKTPPIRGRRDPGRADACLRPVGNVSSASPVSGSAQS